MKRSVLLFVVDSADIPVAIRSHAGFVFPHRDLSPLDEPRAVAAKLGNDVFGEGFSIVERLGSFKFDDSSYIVFEGRAIRFDSRHATVGADGVTSPQIETILSLIANRLLERAA